MKNAIKCLLLCSLALITSSLVLPASAHPTAIGKSCHAVYVHQTDVLNVHQLAIVEGDQIFPPGNIEKANGTDNGKARGFDSAMLPAFYVGLRIYSWYVPHTIGKELTKSPGSIKWQSAMFMRTNHDKL